jgi:UDP-N-acetylmuramoyl-tripeptide--D-alanyl-D-alanine ligase
MAQIIRNFTLISMPCSTLTQLADVLVAKPLNLSNSALESRFTQITTDTRSLKPGEVFVALRGEKFDGHEFVSVAIEKGAIAAIVDFQFSNHDFPVLQVQDTLQAYQKIASWWREQFNIPVIGITGSVGKTTTKELIAAVLATKGNVLKTAANYNNEIGVPKTLLELSPEHDYAVIEMAMRAKGEIALLTDLVRPTVGVITNVGTAHIGRLGSEEAIAQAKCELLAQMPSNSVAILNYDNSRLIATAKTVWQGETLTYGLESGDIQGQLVDNQIYVDGIQLPLPLPGRHNASNFLAALAVAKVLQIDWSLLSAGLKIDLPGGRSQRYNLPNDLVILDESYNAAPEAMTAALNLLAETPGLRHIAVVGAMKELGERSPQFHKEVGITAKQLNLDALLILVDGADAAEIANGAEGMAVECFSSHADLVKRLQEFVEKGDRILFKASHSVGLDRVVNQFRADYVAQD